MADPQQSALEARLVELNASAIFNIQTLPTLQDGKLKDADTALEREFASMRAVMRELQFLAEDQEEEDEMSVQDRLQRYQQQYQDIQASYSQAKLQKRVDPREENRRLLLSGADPSKRQQELQTEAELVGAAQSVTGSLQRSRQVMLEQIDNTQSILASMDASHEQLSKVTKEYQGQSDVFGTSKRLLRTLKRHSSWDKLVLYGGAAMFLLVCLYVIQKRSLYFVPTFVKTGLGKLVPTWSRSSAKDIDHLTHPIKARADDPGTDGLRQKPSQETLTNAQQAQQLLERHTKQQKPAEPPDKQTRPPPATAASGNQASAAGKAVDQVTERPIQQQPKDSTKHNAASKEAEPDRRFVTDQQMRDSGHAEAFAKILQDIPESIKAGGPQGPDYTGALNTKSDGDISSEEGVQQAVAAAVEHAQEQQQHQALSLDAGQAYPQNTAQVGLGDAALPQHAALLRDSNATAPSHGDPSADLAETGTQTDAVTSQTGTQTDADTAQTGTQTGSLKGEVPDSLSSSDDRHSLQDSVSDAISGLLDTASSLDRLQSDDSNKGEVNVEQPLQAERQQTEPIAPGSSNAIDSDEPAVSQSGVNISDGQTDLQTADHRTAGSSDADTVFQTEAQDVGSAAQGEQAHSVPQEAAWDSSHSDAGTQYQTDSQDLSAVSDFAPRQSVAQQSGAASDDEADSQEGVAKRPVTQQQMDETGYGDAFAAILASIPDHVRDKSVEQQTDEPQEDSKKDVDSQDLLEHSEL